jgi:SAM-dependent methyltransferase
MIETAEEVRSRIKDRFVKVALEPQAKQRHPTGPLSAKQLGYDPVQIDALPAQVSESFAGVGNPLALGELRPGDTVLDLGCGAGLDSILAARKVGPAGKVVGIDMTEEMVAKAIANAAAAGIANAEFHQGEADQLPVADRSVDVVISNGVFNLCLDKPRVLAEVFRVLRPGGHIRMADILLEERVTAEQVQSKGSWSE